jgi:hypothetical protein
MRGALPIPANALMSSTVALRPAGTAADLARRVGVTTWLACVWCNFFRPEEWVWRVGISSWEWTMAFAVLLVVSTVLIDTLPSAIHPVTVGAVLFLAASVLAQIHAVSPEVGWFRVHDLCGIVVLNLLAAALVDTPVRLLAMLGVVAGSFGVRSARFGLGFLLGRVGSLVGLVGAFGDLEGYAVGVAMNLPLLVAVGRNVAKPWLRRATFAMAALSALPIPFAHSGAAVLALAVGGLLVIALDVYRRSTLFAVLIGVLLMAALSLSVIRAPMSWRGAAETLRQRPLGIGLGGAPAARSSHIAVMAETGVSGLVVYIGLFFCGYSAAFRIRQPSADQTATSEMQRLRGSCANAAIASMTAFLIGGTFVAIPLNELTWITFALVAAVDRLSAMPNGPTEPRAACAP